jgi:hypothetical protein
MLLAIPVQNEHENERGGALRTGAFNARREPANRRSEGLMRCG